MQAEKEIAFGRFRLDLTNECLWQGTRAISLRPKTFAVLRLLLQRPGLLVTKQQVLDAVWPETFVGDGVLKDNIRQLREALDDDAESPIYIETAHRRGYRFIGKLTELAPSQNLSAAGEMPPSQVASKSAAFTSSAIANEVLGRDAELARMRGWLERALAGERQTIFITGEPGIGKTTIVQAFLEQVTRVPGLRVARGQCLEQYGAAEAYLPVLDGFSRLCRSRGGTQVLDILRQEASAWLVQMPSLVPQSERETLRAQVAATTRERMLREMAEAIETLTSESPMLLILEDLHWSDYSTLDLVAYLARRQDPARLMVIGTYRPVDVIVGEHPLKGVKRELQAHGLCHELPLEYLDEDAVAQYLQAKFPRHQFPNRLQQSIFGRTEGNPLFLVNLVEYLIDQKMVVEKNGISKLRVDLPEIEQGVPANLRQLIEKQIERLSPDERTVLEAASVAGAECSSTAIAAGLDMSIEWVDQQCEQLARRHRFLSPAWLVELPDGTMTSRRRFIHILYRDVPYRLMPAMRRSQIHRRIAEREVVIYGDRRSEIAAELAMHFEQGRDWPRASQHLIQAARNAMQKSAHHEAAELARRGLKALEPLPRSAERSQQEITLRMILSIALMATRGFASTEVEQVYAEGKELFEFSGTSPQLFKALYLRGVSYLVGGQLTSAMEIAERLLPLSEELKDPTLVMEAHRAMGATLIELGRCPEALKYLDKASHLYSTNRHHFDALTIGHDCKVLSECYAGRALWALGFPDAALERTKAGLTFAREISHPQSWAAAAHFASELHQLRGEPLLAQERAREVLKVADEYSLEPWIVFGTIDFGWADIDLGNVQQGIEQVQQGLAAYEATGGKLWCPRFLSLLAVAFAKAERVQDGLAAIAKALLMAKLNGETYAMSELLRVKGELILKQHDQPQPDDLLTINRSGTPATLEAHACFAEAIAIARHQQTRSWELRACIGMDRLDTQQGKSDHTRLAESYSSFTEGYETADLKQAKVMLDRVLVTHSPVIGLTPSEASR
jgi:DNA-binding winged helix-turn-helix (wHTH) protein/predicted ATPase